MLDFLRFYNRSQKYNAEIIVDVANIGSQDEQVEVVIPVPFSADYQVITPAFEQSTITRTLQLKSGESNKISIKFQAEVKPRKVKNIDPRVVKANEFVINFLSYGNPIDGLYTADEARKFKVVDCGGFDTLLQDELSKVGIKSEVVAGFWAGYKDNQMHAWLEIEGGLPADPSVEHLRRQSRTKKSGRLGFVGSDRIAFSKGDPFLQHPFLKTENKNIKYEKHFYCTRA